MGPLNFGSPRPGPPVPNGKSGPACRYRAFSFCKKQNIAYFWATGINPLLVPPKQLLKRCCFFVTLQKYKDSSRRGCGVSTHLIRGPLEVAHFIPSGDEEGSRVERASAGKVSLDVPRSALQQLGCLRLSGTEIGL